MRDDKRIFPFMNEIAALWQISFPDWRFGQVMDNFESWVRTNKSQGGIFYLEEDRFLEYFKEFCEAVGYKG